MSSDLRALIRRIEGGERSLELQIAIYCRINEEWRPCARPYLAMVERNRDRKIAPLYFTSLDDARTLVPDGEDYSCGTRTRAPHAWAVTDFSGRAPTRWAEKPEVALTLAALYARLPPA